MRKRIRRVLVSLNAGSGVDMLSAYSVSKTFMRRVPLAVIRLVAKGRQGMVAPQR